MRPSAIAALNFLPPDTAENPSDRPAVMGDLADGRELTIPVAHNEGQFFTDEGTLAQIQDVASAFTYQPSMVRLITTRTVQPMILPALLLKTAACWG